MGEGQAPWAASHRGLPIPRPAFGLVDSPRELGRRLALGEGGHTRGQELQLGHRVGRRQRLLGEGDKLRRGNLGKLGGAGHHGESGVVVRQTFGRKHSVSRYAVGS